MTSERDLERRLYDAFQSDHSTDRAVSLHQAAMARAARSRQRPGWLIAVSGETFAGSAVVAPRRTTLVVVLVALLTIALGFAVVAGAFRPPMTSTEPGTIFYSTWDKAQSSYQLRSIRSDGSDPRDIVEGVAPAVSTDGSVLMYMHGWLEEGGQVFVAGRDGLSPRPVPDVGTSALPRLAPDGTRIAWLKFISPVELFKADGTANTYPDGGRENELWVSPVSGEPGVRIAPQAPAPNAWFGRPVWSPDSRRIAFSESTALIDGNQIEWYQSGLWVVNADGSDLRRISSAIGPLRVGGAGVLRPSYGMTFDSAEPSWSPDGRWIAFTAVAADARPRETITVSYAASLYGAVEPDVFVISPDGGPERAVTSTPNEAEWQPLWSPDGTHLAYNRGDSVATISMDGDKSVGGPSLSPPTEAGSWTSLGAWSPDGRSLLVIQAIPSGGPSDGPGFVSATRDNLVAFDPDLTLPGRQIVVGGPMVHEFGMAWAP